MLYGIFVFFFFFQAEDGIRDHAQSRGLGDVYKRQYQRRVHGSTALNEITDEFGKFCRNNSKSKQAKNFTRVKNADDQLNMLVSLPEYKDLLTKYKMHLQVLDQCFQKIKPYKEVIELEQSIATGVGVDGRETKDPKIIQELIKVLSDNSYNQLDKLRLILITFLTIDLHKDDQKELIQFLNEDQKPILRNLEQLGYQQQISDTTKKSHKRLNENEVKLTQKNFSQNKLDQLNWHTPKIQTVVELILQCIQSNQDVSAINLKQVSINESNYKKQMQKMQVQLTEQSKSIKLKNEIQIVKPAYIDPEQELINTPKIVIFSPSGLSYTEIAALRQLDQQFQSKFFFILGSTSLIKPVDFIESLKTMANSKQMKSKEIQFKPKQKDAEQEKQDEEKQDEEKQEEEEEKVELI
eukprot:TRINITY_DN3007_c0_g1_i1.p1 TRINITY_DN3007_c0_g1~~TRINITY_DN3007_c0_g1_i1.p1  ORF type:complete len:409 (+),score=92.14 TRINITY_DN3007_c0_g1_i1:67-1293(+)